MNNQPKPKKKDSAGSKPNGALVYRFLERVRIWIEIEEIKRQPIHPEEDSTEAEDSDFAY